MLGANSRDGRIVVDDSHVSAHARLASAHPAGDRQPRIVPAGPIEYAGPMIEHLAVPGQPSRRRTLRSLATTLAFVWLACAAFTLLQQISGLLTLDDFEPNPVGFLAIVTLYYWLPWLVLAPCVAICSAHFPIRPDRWALPVVVHAGLLLTLALVHGLGVAFFYHYVTGTSPAMAEYAPWQHAGHFLFGDDMLLFDTVVYAVFAATLNIRNFHHIVRQQELDTSRLNQRLAELKLETLRAQIDPHFLFNALNAVSVLIRKSEKARAEEAITLLSGFFRRTLESSNRHHVQLDEELDLVRRYVAVAKLRFGERLTVHEHYDPAARSAIVPAMLLQPLVENAVTHGFGDKTGACELGLSCRVAGERLVIEIEDDGIGCDFDSVVDSESGTGLSNVRGRLEQMYGAAHTFEISSAPRHGTRIRIELPLDAAHGGAPP